MSVSRPNTQFIDFKFEQDNGQGRASVNIIREVVQIVHHFKYNKQFKRGGERWHGNINFPESECSMEKVVYMQRSVVQQEDTNETEGKCSHNCCQTSYVVWCRDLETISGHEARLYGNEERILI